ncbi:MAG: type III pantothenate kinase [Bacteroidia bacterium]|jgi:type III pantothenate kinase|nr:type III pantothenate kinase [Bacteroidia bacterium]
MPWNLILDFGNTRLKASLFFDGALREHHILETPTADAVLEVAGGKPVQAGILASVRSDDAGLEDALTDFFPLHRLGPDTRLPITNKYGSPHTLGYDRIAASCAAGQLFAGRPVLAIVAGTCITYNFTTAAGGFLGGAISPGIGMRLRAMHEYTQRLPLVDMQGPVAFPATDTDTSLRTGAVYAAQLEANAFYLELKAQYPELAAVIGGGDASVLANGLKNDIFARPFLVQEGLNRILEYHASNL